MRIGERAVKDLLQNHLEPGVEYIEVYPDPADVFRLRSLPKLAVRPSNKKPTGDRQSALLVKAQFLDFIITGKQKAEEDKKFLPVVKAAGIPITNEELNSKELVSDPNVFTGHD